MKTEVEIGEFKGSPTITIWEIDDKGNRKQYPLITVGTKKAKAIIEHIEALKEFIK